MCLEYSGPACSAHGPFISLILFFSVLSVFSLVIISLWKFFQVFLILKSWYYVFLSHLFLPQDWMVISEKNVHILIHGTRLHDFVWKRGLCSFKLRILRWDHPGLFRWAQIQWWVSLEEPEKGWDRHGGESDVKKKNRLEWSGDNPRKLRAARNRSSTGHISHEASEGG